VFGAMSDGAATHDVDPGAAPVSRRVAPLPWWFHVVLVVGVAALLWGTSTPMLNRNWLTVGGAVVTLASLGWLVQVVALVRNRQWSKGVLVLPLVMIVMGVALGIEAPLKLRWGATFHDPFESLTESVRPEDAPMTVGGLRVTQIERFGGDLVFHLEGEGVIDDGGLAFSMDGLDALLDSSGHEFGNIREIDTHWYVWNDD
jgi:hypothetical protein